MVTRWQKLVFVKLKYGHAPWAENGMLPGTSLQLIHTPRSSGDKGRWAKRAWELQESCREKENRNLCGWDSSAQTPAHERGTRCHKTAHACQQGQLLQWLAGKNWAIPMICMLLSKDTGLFYPITLNKNHKFIFFPFTLSNSLTGIYGLSSDKHRQN